MNWKFTDRLKKKLRLKMKKSFILDTNVILNDHNCLIGFEDNNIIIPTIVLEELDNIKKRSNVIGQNARMFIRKLEKIMEDKEFNEIKSGISLGDKKGLLYILRTADLPSENVLNNFKEKSPDNVLLSITQHLMESNEFESVVLVTMDINLRVKARSIGLVAEDYKNSKIENVSTLYNSILDENADSELIQRLYNDGRVPKKDYNKDKKIIHNQYLILKNGSSSVLCYYDKKTDALIKIEKETAYGITPKNAEQVFTLNALMRDDIKLIAITGVPGGGKTLLSLAAAIEKRKNYKQIFLSRPIIALMDKDLGYLPGKAEEKVNPYMKPLYDNLYYIRDKFKETSEDFKKIDRMINENKINIEPLAYLRGRSISNVYYIIDEAQNITPEEVKTIITRAGEGTKIIFTGDIEQIDISYLNIENNGLSHLIEKMKGEEIFAHIDLSKGERSALAELGAKKL
jgi:PhoH-like ATPase